MNLVFLLMSSIPQHKYTIKFVYPVFCCGTLESFPVFAYSEYASMDILGQVLLQQ